MLPLFRIWSVALYEMKALMRSVLYKVFLVSFALPAFLFIKAYDSITDALFSHVTFAVLFIFSPFIAAFTLFIACDTLTREQIADGSGMIHARPQTNTEYLFGKAIAVFLVILAGIEAFLITFAILTSIFLHPSFSVAGFILTTLLMTVPTVTILIGTAFLFTGIVRNTAFAVTFLSAGFMAVTFFAGSYWYGLSDYAALRVPLMYSDFTGPGDISSILEHRGVWFLTGISFVFLATFFIRRIPNSGRERMTALSLAVVCLCGASALGNMYITDIRSGRELRVEMNTLSREIAKQPRVTITDCRIDLRHRGKKIEAVTVLRFMNQTNKPLDRYTFTLNPGLEALEISRAKAPSPFLRKLHIITVTPHAPLEPGASDSLTIRYRGRIEPDACWADLPEREWGNSRRDIFGLAMQFGFITPRYVLLTPECLWYPTAGAPYGSVFPHTMHRDFTRFSLRVETAPKLTVISQGMIEKRKPGDWTFSPETALPQLSLAIGEYEKKSVTVDSVEYLVYVKRGHDYFSRYFPGLGDTLPGILREYREYYEQYVGRRYPFKRLILVETPLHFHSFQRFWSSHMETQQPEMIFLPEKGLNVAQFAMNLHSIREFRKKLSPMEIQKELLDTFIQRHLLVSNHNMSFNTHYKRMMGQIRWWSSVFSSTSNSGYDQNRTVFPNFYRFTNAVVSESNPLIDSIIEMYYVSKSPNSSSLSFEFGVASNMLAGRCPGEVLTDPDFRDCGPEILKCASRMLFNRLETEFGGTRVEAFFRDYLDSMRGRCMPADSLFRSFRACFGRDLEAEASNILIGKSLPSCVVTEAKISPIPGAKGARYQVRFEAYNPEPVEGTFAVGVSTSRRSGKSMFTDVRDSYAAYRYFTLPGGTAKEIGFIVDEQINPYLGIDTFLSKNRPNSYYLHLMGAESEPGVEPFDGERPLDHPPVFFAPGEIVVDNTDSGFQLLPGPEPSLLRRLLHRPSNAKRELDSSSYWWMKPPARWSLAIDNRFYGPVQKSAYIIRRGKGENRARWTAEIPARGEYQLLYHTPPMKSFLFPDTRYFAKDFHFRIITANGAEEQIADLQNALAGWTTVGSFSLSAGKAVVELSDLTKGGEVYADAIKWAKKTE